jgi:hypothetical protein
MEVLSRDQALMTMILGELKVQNEAYGRMNEKCMKVIDLALAEVDEGGEPSRTVKRMATSLVTSMMKLKLDTLKCLIQWERMMADKKRRGEAGDGADALRMTKLMAAWGEHGPQDGEAVEGYEGFVADRAVPAEQEAGDFSSK